MRTRAHWEKCKELTSYHAAHQVGLELREIAKKQGFHPKGVKILSKKEVDSNGSIADAQVKWEEGPPGWTQFLRLMITPGVWTEIEDPYTVSFYDIYF